MATISGSFSRRVSTRPVKHSQNNSPGKPPVALSMIETRIAKIGNPLNLQAIAVLKPQNN
jgi:hypothetical protein